MILKVSYIKFCVYACLLVSVVGCIKRTQIKKQPREYPLFTDEARLLDIPLPVNTAILDLSQNSDEYKRQSYILGYTTEHAMHDILVYYRTQMECFGWKETMSSEGAEACIVFEKPSKQCVVQVRRNKVVLFIGPKKNKN